MMFKEYRNLVKQDVSLHFSREKVSAGMGILKGPVIPKKLKFYLLKTSKFQRSL